MGGCCTKRLSGLALSLAFLHWVRIALHPSPFVSDIAVFVLKKGDVKLQLTDFHQPQFVSELLLMMMMMMMMMMNWHGRQTLISIRRLLWLLSSRSRLEVISNIKDAVTTLMAKRSFSFCFRHHEAEMSSRSKCQDQGLELWSQGQINFSFQPMREDLEDYMSATVMALSFVIWQPLSPAYTVSE